MSESGSDHCYHSKSISPKDSLYVVKDNGGKEDDDDKEMPDEEEEAQEPARLKDTVKPSPDEVAVHMVSHLPYRDWCPHCVRGRALSRTHMSKRLDEQKGGSRSAWTTGS